MNEAIRYLWQQAVLDAFMASHAELATKINLAEIAIASRLKEANDPDLEEHAAIRDVLRVLIAELGTYRSVSLSASQRKDIA
jgi:capsid portal protein